MASLTQGETEANKQCESVYEGGQFLVSAQRTGCEAATKHRALGCTVLYCTTPQAVQFCTVPRPRRPSIGGKYISAPRGRGSGGADIGAPTQGEAQTYSPLFLLLLPLLQVI